MVGSLHSETNLSVLLQQPPLSQRLRTLHRTGQQQQSPRGNSNNNSMQPSSISATATAGAAARAQLGAHALLKQQLQQAAPSASYLATADKLQLPLHKLTLGADFLQDSPGPDDWTISTAVSASPKTATAAGTGHSSESPRAGHLIAATAPAAATRALQVRKRTSPVVPTSDIHGTPALSANEAAAPSPVSGLQGFALDAIIAEGYEMVCPTVVCHKAAPPRQAASKSTAPDATACPASHPVTTRNVDIEQHASIRLPAHPVASPGATAAGRIGTESTMQVFRPGQVIHYSLKVPAPEMCSKASSQAKHIELELELLGCFGLGVGELYHVRLHKDAAVPAWKLQPAPPDAGRPFPADAASCAASDSNAEMLYVQYHKGQEFALKLSGREIPMTEGHVIATRDLLRKESRLKYATCRP